jgi:HD-GYP domain-containing protein (c-di-GMP phosphodiesterase class II)
VRSHHELLDGTGYPDGLRGAAVPLLAQVTAVADVYDALTSDRPYRRALPAERALETLRDEAKCGKRDAALVEEFAALIVDGESPSIAHQSSDLHGSNIALLSSR